MELKLKFWLNHLEPGARTMLGKGEIKTTGASPPECLEPEVIDAFLAKLAEKV